MESSSSSFPEGMAKMGKLGVKNAIARRGTGMRPEHGEENGSGQVEDMLWGCRAGIEADIRWNQGISGKTKIVIHDSVEERPHLKFETAGSHRNDHFCPQRG
jgi:hypothetical protein